MSQKGIEYCLECYSTAVNNAEGNFEILIFNPNFQDCGENNTQI